MHSSKNRLQFRLVTNKFTIKDSTMMRILCAQNEFHHRKLRQCSPVLVRSRALSTIRNFTDAFVNCRIYTRFFEHDDNVCSFFQLKVHTLVNQLITSVCP